jgi:hypothetical protein
MPPGRSDRRQNGRLAGEAEAQLGVNGRVGRERPYELGFDAAKRGGSLSPDDDRHREPGGNTT